MEIVVVRDTPLLLDDDSLWEACKLVKESPLDDDNDGRLMVVSCWVEVCVGTRVTLVLDVVIVEAAAVQLCVEVRLRVRNPYASTNKQVEVKSICNNNICMTGSTAATPAIVRCASFSLKEPYMFYSFFSPALFDVLTEVHSWLCLRQTYV